MLRVLCDATVSFHRWEIVLNILFVHRDFPGQFGALAERLALSTHHRVAFITSAAVTSRADMEVRRFAPRRQSAATTHHYLHSFEAGVLNAQAVFESCHRLREEGFTPDVIIAHCGWGVTLYLREAFPKARLVGYFEWYYHPHDGDADYLDPAAMTADNACRIRTLNAPILMTLEDVDLGLIPTAFQQSKLPQSYQHKLLTLHDGVDTSFFKPDTSASRQFDMADFTHVNRLVTYATRGMEPYRGFPEFMRAIDGLLRADASVEIAIAGEDKTFYSRRLPGGETYKERLLRELPALDLARVHFMGTLDRDDYRRLLQISTVHVYLTVPFVPSWSLVEAMACGCHIVASDTEPTREILGDESTARFIEHRDIAQLQKVLQLALADSERTPGLRENARNRAVSTFSQDLLLPRWEAIAIGAGDIAAQNVPPKYKLE